MHFMNFKRKTRDIITVTDTDLGQKNWWFHCGFSGVVKPQVVVNIVAIIVHVQLLVSGIEVQVGILILEPFKGNTDVALLFGFGVVLVKYLFGFDINCFDCIQNATHHEGIAHAWFIDTSLPFLLNPKRKLVYFCNDHTTSGLLIGIGQPQAAFISRKVKVLIGGVGVGEPAAGSRNNLGLIFPCGEIQFGQPKRFVDLIIESVVTEDEIVPCAIPAAV